MISLVAKMLGPNGLLLQHALWINLLVHVRRVINPDILLQKVSKLLVFLIGEKNGNTIISIEGEHRN